MQRLLWAEPRDEIAARKAGRPDGSRPRRPGLTWGTLGAAICLALLIVI